MRSLAAAGCLLILALAGCGGSGDEPEPRPPPPPPRFETIDHLPDLPNGWRRYVDETGGFAVGLPRGWRARSIGPGSLIRSYDRLVAISILPDRSPDARAVPIDDFATQAAEALRGFGGGLRSNGIWSFRHRYRAAAVGGEGTSKRGVDQRVRVIVLRRDDQATFTVVIAANVERTARPSERLASRVVRTLRARPPEPRRARGKG